MSFFISSAHAQAAGDAAASAQSSPVFSLIMLAVFGAGFYFMIWRPQSKRASEHKNLLTALGKGDEIITSSGILGRLTKVDDLYITLQVSDTLELKMQKSAVAGVLPKGTLKSI